MIQIEARAWPLVEVVDPSMTRGLYVCYFQMDPRTDRWYLTWACHIHDAPISVMVEQLKRERRFIRDRDPELCIMDAKGGRHRVDKERDEDWFMRFRQFGLDYVPNDEPTTLEEVDEWLKLVWDPILEKAVPKLSITERVANIHRGPLWGLQRFQWDPFMTQKEFLQQPGKDWVDCIKYFCNQRSINRGRLRKRGADQRDRATKRHSKLAASYGFGGAQSPRRRLFSLPTYR